MSSCADSAELLQRLWRTRAARNPHSPVGCLQRRELRSLLCSSTMRDLRSDCIAAQPWWWLCRYEGGDCQRSLSGSWQGMQLSTCGSDLILTRSRHPQVELPECGPGPQPHSAQGSARAPQGHVDRQFAMCTDTHSHTAHSRAAFTTTMRDEIGLRVETIR